MNNPNYFTTTRIWLHLEEFHNRGLTPERSKQIIEALPDPGSAVRSLHCEPMHVNNNWVIETSLSGVDHSAISDLVAQIWLALEIEIQLTSPTEELDQL